MGNVDGPPLVEVQEPSGTSGGPGVFGEAGGSGTTPHI
jgi:hypothetical protein